MYEDKITFVDLNTGLVTKVKNQGGVYKLAELFIPVINFFLSGITMRKCNFCIKHQMWKLRKLAIDSTLIGLQKT